MEEEERLKVSFAICDSKLRLCQSIDAKDWNEYRNLLTEDFRMNVYKQCKTFSINGRNATITRIRQHIDSATTTHMMEGVKLSTDGNEATALFSMRIRVIFGSKGVSMSGTGISHERWVRQCGEWKVSWIELKKWRTERQPLASTTTTVQ